MKIESMISPRKTAVSSESEGLILQLCQRVKALEEVAEYEAAREAMHPYWSRIGEPPNLDGLNELESAQVLLRAGTLSGWIGSAQQIPGAQEIAKDLISQAARTFARLELPELSAEAQVDLALCYWREGAFDEARVTLDEALNQLGDLDSEQRLRALLNRAIIERVSTRYEDALRTHREAAPLFAVSTNDNLKGKFHNEYATVLKNFGLASHREDYVDQALIEYSAALFHVEKAGNKRFHAMIENNVGYLFVRLGRYPEATQHLDQARALFKAVKDKGMVAQVDDTRARALIARGSFTKAEAVARGAVQVLKEGDELSKFAEALTTHGIALARLGNFSKARATLEQAIRVSHDAGDPESGGIAALAIAEELADHLPVNELITYFRMAESELGDSQHPEIQSSLGKTARRLVVSKLVTESPSTKVRDETAVQPQPETEASGSPGFSIDVSLENHVLKYEADLISRALAASDGSVTRAARMLGVTHQGLAFILNGRHKDLLSARKPVKRRRRSIIRYR
ncbi:MAG TPA: helix-turn-helix domain-containing protein [Pyrinomonadaceae bacterium]|jgi:tetratricopeptide (TPR) repeat protein|nr:helix-turn-helix domain-containing protein [Pyrinomonadaceae bacterium]